MRLGYIQFKFFYFITIIMRKRGKKRSEERTEREMEAERDVKKKEKWGKEEQRSALKLKS